MVPLGIIAGLGVGRLWIVPITGVSWAVLLGADRGADASTMLGGFGLAAVNAAIGVVIHQIIRRTAQQLLRMMRR